jgi:hypothetical protein
MYMHISWTSLERKKEEAEEIFNIVSYIHVNHDRVNSDDKLRQLHRAATCVDNSKKHISTIRRTVRTTRRKYLDYFIFKIVDYIAPLRASAVPCNARGLAVACSRKLSKTLGGSTSTRPRVRKITLKTCDFVDISNATILTALGGSTTTSPPIVVLILRQQLASLYIIDYGRADDGAPNKS